MRFVSEARLRDWLGTLASERALIAPVRVQEDLVLYQGVSEPDQIALDHTRTAISPKEFFLPATEAIVTIERVRQASNGADPEWQVQLSEPAMDGEQVLFAVRPCDAHALLALDALLLQPPVDTYYAQRREHSTLIGLACAQMGPSCFCTSLQFTPDDSTGMDLMLYPVEGGYAVADGGPEGSPSEKGRALIESLGLPAYEGPVPQYDWPAPTIAKVAPRLAWEQAFNDPYWARLADRCLSCKICSYVCPTCRCFDVRDYTVAQSPGYQKIERLRCWDSCMAEGYRRIAGGHNPRATGMQRLRNRFYCKFDYYPADFGPTACVGCGRCVDLCPVNVDVTEVVQAIASRGADGTASA